MVVAIRNDGAVPRKKRRVKFHLKRVKHFPCVREPMRPVIPGKRRKFKVIRKPSNGKRARVLR
jgi:hypothetical protein